MKTKALTGACALWVMVAAGGGWGFGDAAAAVAPASPSGDRITSCSWDRPGHDPFTGDVVATLDRYRDLPSDVRQRLQQRMAVRQYDDLVTIRRDTIEGKQFYEPRISEMHFGEGKVCGDVTRSKWTDSMQERGLVYCDSGHCILVPTVCRNVSRIAQRPTAVAPAYAEAGEPPAAALAGPLGESFERLASAAPLSDAGSVGPVSDGPVPSGFYFPPGFGLPPPGGGGGGTGGTPVPPVPIPEPGTWLLMAAGLGLVVRRSRQRGRAGVPRCATQKR